MPDPTPIKCEAVIVHINHPTAGVAIRRVPAYTVPPLMLAERITRLVTEYMDKSRDQGESVSLGDFAIFLVDRASRDPDEQVPS